MLRSMLSFVGFFASIKQYYDEKYDRSNFIKNVILDNILPGDIYLKARELHFNSEVSRVCLLIKIVSKTDVSAYDIVQNLFPDKSKDFVININEVEIALVKEIKPDTESRDLEKLASSISDTLSSEFYTHCVVGIGTTVTGIKDLARSFKEAQSALEVAKVFDTDRTIVSYDNLGIARLIYQLPTTLCEMFLKEVFKRGSIESLDQETLFTIQRFFENNLNVSKHQESFVHRNTLVYRLEKLKSSQVLTSVSLRTQSCSRLLLWLRNTSTQVLQNTDLVKVCPSIVRSLCSGRFDFYEYLYNNYKTKVTL